MRTAVILWYLPYRPGAWQVISIVALYVKLTI